MGGDLGKIGHPGQASLLQSTCLESKSCQEEKLYSLGIG